MSSHALVSPHGTNRLAGDTAQTALSGRMSRGLSQRRVRRAVPHRGPAVEVPSTRRPAVAEEPEPVWLTEPTGSVPFTAEKLTCG